MRKLFGAVLLAILAIAVPGIVSADEKTRQQEDAEHAEAQAREARAKADKAEAEAREARAHADKAKAEADEAAAKDKKDP